MVQITGGRPAPEYLVDFAPKSQRDYGAHARLAQLLLPRIAPEPALQFLAHTPEALDALDKYLCGQDRDSLVATIVRRADQLSTQRALQSGKKGRFPTSKAVPLIDLLMQAIVSMLQAGTELPLNRTGGAAWVYDGAIWFVAKRLADSVREWLKKHEPDEAVPGDAKNDRLFDTWQDYGVLELNPLTGQAVWHVTVHGQSAGSEAAGPGSYTHDLAMLKFPLAKVFSHESKYPAVMQGRLEVREKRKDDAGEGSSAAAMPALSIPAAGQVAPEAAAGPQVNAAGPSAPAAKKDVKLSAADKKLASVMREPVFKAPPAAGRQSAPEPTAKAPKPAAGQEAPAAAPPAKAPRPGPVPLAPEVAPGPSAPSPSPPRTAPEHRAHEAAPMPAAQPPRTAPIQLEPEAAADAPPPAAPQALEIDPADAAYLLDASDDFLEALAPVARARSMKGAKPEQPARPRAGGAAAPAQSSEAAAVPARPAPSVQEHEPAAQAGQAPEAAATSLPAAAMRPEPTGAPAPADSVATVPAPAPVQPPRSHSVSAEYRRRLVDDLDELPPVMARAAVTRPAPAGGPEPVLLLQELPSLDDGQDKPPPEPSELAMAFMDWVQQSLAKRDMKFNETGAMVHFVEEGMALVSPRIFREYAKAAVADPAEAAELANRAQRELIKCGWHLPGANKINIVKYEIHAKGSVVGTLACVVLIQPGRFVLPVPPSNPALKMA